MTQQDDITQRVLTDDEIRGEIHNAIGFGFEPGELQSVNAADLMNVAYALLSKVSAPIADSTLPLEQALHELIDKIVPGLDTGDFVQDARRASTALSAILASAPVAGEAKNYPGDNVAERLDNMADDQPPGSQAQSDLYAAATIWRKHITHRAAPQDSAEDDWKSAIRKFMDTAIPALAAIANVHTPDEIDALDAMPREPVIDQVRRLSHASEELGRLVHSKQPQADKDGGQQRAGDVERLRRIAWLIGCIFVHGNFKAETFNERELEKLLRENGTFWDSLEQFDAALSAPQAEQGERDA